MTSMITEITQLAFVIYVHTVSGWPVQVKDLSPDPRIILRQGRYLRRNMDPMERQHLEVRHYYYPRPIE